MKILRQSLLTQLVSSFSLLSLVTVSLVSFSAYQRARESLQESVFERLNVAVALKEFELNQWLIYQRQEVLLLARSPVVTESLPLLLPGQTSPPPTPIDPAAADPAAVSPDAAATEAPPVSEEGAAEIPATDTPADPMLAEETAILAQYFGNVVDIKPTIQEVDILTVGGIVIFSTDPSQTGVYKGLGNTTTYFESDQEEIALNIYTEPLTGQPTVTLATPIVNGAGERQAVLAITLNLDAVNQLIGERTGLGETGETYLVQRQLSGENAFVSGQPLEENQDEQLGSISSFAIDEAMQGINGRDLYDNYAGVPVIGVYRWLGQNNVGLFAELSQAEAFAPAVLLARDIFLVGLISAGLLLVLVYLLARQIVRPVLTITDTAARLESGSYEATALDTVKNRPDELGQLARVFQTMAQQVYAREQRLKRQLAELTIEIDQARKERQVAEITETSYFQELSQKAKDLRQQRQSKE